MEINNEIIQSKIIDPYGTRSSTFDPNKYFKIMFDPIETETKKYFFTKVVTVNELPVPLKKTILLVIDKSGSMSGKNMDHT